MSPLEAAAVLVAGVAAGTINTIVGSGTLITFPTLLFLGVSPLVANVSNNIGLVAGGVTGSYGYRHELTGQSRTLRRMMPLSFLGSVVGAALLLRLPAAAFHAIVPSLILLALVLVVAGPRLQEVAASRHTGSDPPWHAWATGVGVFVAGIYGGYFGAAQGVLLMGVLSVLSAEPLQRLNGYKNVLSLIVNVVAAVTFVLFARDKVHWPVVGLIGVGAFVGGVIGSHVGRRIPPTPLRGLIIVIGLVAVVKMVWFP